MRTETNATTGKYNPILIKCPWCNQVVYDGEVHGCLDDIVITIQL